MNDLYTVNSDIHEHNTRQKHLLHTNNGSTNQFNRSFSNISARVLNLLQTINGLRFLHLNSNIYPKPICWNSHLTFSTQNDVAIFILLYFHLLYLFM